MPIRSQEPTTDRNYGRTRSLYGPLLLVILVLAATLRFAGLDWDDGYYLHPDERFMVMVTVDTSWPESIGQYFDSETSPLNPYNTRHGTFVYGTFPLFLTKAISGLFGNDVYGQAHLAGRALSALADVGTVFLTAWIARRVFGDKAGLLAGFLIACTMLHIQSAHFYTVDAMSVFFATATFVAVIKGWDRRHFGWYAVAGMMIGLAGASKPNYLIALGFLALPALEALRLHGLDGLIPSGKHRRIVPVIPAVLIAGLVAFWTFRLGQPYAFAGPNVWNIGLNRQWLDDLSYWSSAQSGLIDVKSSVQWVGRTPIAYIVENMVRWGMGPPLGLATLAALGVGVWNVLRSRTWPNWWFTGMLVWSIAQLVLYGTNIAQAQRYLLPIYPFLIVLAAGLLLESVRRLRNVEWVRQRPRWANPGTILIAITVIYTAFYSVAFDSLYVRPLSRVQASEWIYENVPEGSTLTHEYWDDALPMALEGEDPWAYQIITLDLYGYEGPDNTKLSKLIGQLNQADYIILSSNRIIESVPRQPERYPMATHYYEMLVDGSLGFDLVAEFKQTPELFGIALDDSNAEETITVYEHPYVRIFEKTDRFHIEQVYAELDAAMGFGGVNYLPGDPVGDHMFLTGHEQATYAENGTWADIFDPDSLANRAPAVWWYIGMQLLSIVALPLAWVLFGRMPDGGYALAKALGLVLVTWVAWIIAGADLLPFGRGVILAACLLVVGAGILAARARLREMVNALLTRWQWVLATEAVFLLAFAGMAWLRSYNAAFWTPDGVDETPFSLAVFNAAARSVSFPPFDAWLGGGQVHLAYWGMLPWVLITRLTGVVPNTGHTLASAGIFAIFCVTLWSAASALIAHSGPRKLGPGWLALLAPVLAGVAGTLRVVAEAGRGGWGYTPRPDSWPIGGTVGDVLYGLGNVITQRPDLTGVPVSEITRAAETPFTSLVTGDLSSATITLPLFALAIAIAVALASCAEGSERARSGLLMAGGIVAGALSASASWGLAIAVGIVVIAIVSRALTRYSLDESWPLARQIVLDTMVVLATAFLAFLPFRLEFVSTPRNTGTGTVPSLDSLGLWLGGLLLIIAVYLCASVVRVIDDARREGPIGLLAAAGTTLLTIIAVMVGLFLESAIVLLVVAVLFVIIALWHRQHQPTHVMTLGFIGIGLLVALFGPLVPLPMTAFGDAAASSLDVIAWTLLGLGTTVVLAWLANALIGSATLPRLIAGSIGGAANILLVVAMLVTPVMVSRAMTITDGSRSLDATAFLASADDTVVNEADRNASRWLMHHVDGLPVVLEAVTMDHQYGGRISAMTGLPTVLGWPTPERMMRPGWEQVVSQRQDAVHRIYSSTGDFTGIEPLLVQYNVELIYVGPLEQQTYDRLALDKFDRAVESGELTVVYEQDGVTIYQYGSG